MRKLTFCVVLFLVVWPIRNHKNKKSSFVYKSDQAFKGTVRAISRDPIYKSTLETFDYASRTDF